MVELVPAISAFNFEPYGVSFAPVVTRLSNTYMSNFVAVSLEYMRLLKLNPTICLLNVDVGAPAGYNKLYKFVYGSLLTIVGGVRLAFSTKEMALKGAKDLGCEGYHEHEFDGKTWYMPCGKHTLAEVPQNAKYTTDYDLLPNKHPKSSKS